MEIIQATYLISSPSVANCPKADRPEYAFIGRSNVGKSSLINALTNKKELAKVSGSPGKTQLINHFNVTSNDKKDWYLVDLPGYGYAKTSLTVKEKFQKLISRYILNRENLYFEFRKYKFTKDHPFAVMSAEDADYLLKTEKGFAVASPGEAAEYYDKK